jgi:hypothetical protein
VIIGLLFEVCARIDFASNNARVSGVNSISDPQLAADQLIRENAGVSKETRCTLCRRAAASISIYPALHSAQSGYVFKTTWTSRNGEIIPVSEGPQI